jgi:hypothetical protein
VPEHSSEELGVDIRDRGQRLSKEKGQDIEESERGVDLWT